MKGVLVKIEPWYVVLYSPWSEQVGEVKVQTVMLAANMAAPAVPAVLLMKEMDTFCGWRRQEH